MRRSITVSGAYGRDYASAKDAIADWHLNKDFTIESVIHGPGMYINLRQAGEAGFNEVCIRYKKKTEVTILHMMTLKGRVKM